MRFEYQLHSSLPGLAWCARVRRGSDVVQVKHGSLVDTRPTFFVEGVWDGPFEEGNLGGCTMLAGSGGTLRNIGRDGGVLFAPPTNMYLWLVSMRVGEELLISNSVVFLLVEAGDSPDIRHPYYHFDILQARRWGLRKQGWTMPTQNGNQMTLLQWRNLFVTRDLDVSLADKGRSETPRTYAQFLSLFRRTLGTMFENAAHAGRVMPLAPLATVTTGYDANAIAAVAASLGCTEALTFCGPDEGHGTDSGSVVGAHLGLHVTEYDLTEYEQLPGLIDAEFAASCTPPLTTNLTVAEKQLRGKLVLTGRPGDAAWGINQEYNLPDLLNPATYTTAGSAHTEFRLRVGYAVFDAPCIVTIHRPALQDIGESEEMKPWRCPGNYNRPVPRRMIEEAGVPGELFGNAKQAGGFSPRLTAAGQADFDAFYENAAIPQWYRKHGFSHWRELPKRALSVLYLLSYSERFGKRMALYKALLPLTLRTDRKRASMINDMIRPRYMYTFHWGFEHMKGRYEGSR